MNKKLDEILREHSPDGTPQRTNDLLLTAQQQRSTIMGFLLTISALLAGILLVAIFKG